MLQTQTNSKATGFTSIVDAASKRGYRLQNKSVGPALSLSLQSAIQERDETLATISGALLPNRLHIESYKSDHRPAITEKQTLLTVTPAMILFIAALALAHERGIRGVYGLAIEDAPEQHQRLIKYLKRFGGTSVMRVTDELRCVPARMFYGGFGTVIRGDVEEMLQRGMAMLRRSTPSG